MLALLHRALRSSRPEAGARPRLVHLHRYRWSGDDWFSNGSLYACRCGVVRSGL